MNERELNGRLAQWLAEGPTGASERVLAVAIEHARRHPRSRPLAERWRGLLHAAMSDRSVPMLAHVAIVLSLVAVAIAVSAAVYVGTQRLRVEATPAPAASASPLAVVGCPGGTDPNRAGDATQPRPIEEGLPGDFVADPTTGRLLLLAGGDTSAINFEWHGTTAWSFDPCTKTWRQGSAQVVDGAVAADPRSSRVLIFGAAEVIGYDIATDTATPLGPVPLPSSQAYHAMSGWHVATDPVGGVIYVRHKESSRLWRYDPAAATWSEIDQRGDVPPSAFTQLMAFDASVGRIVLYQRSGEKAATYEFDPARDLWTQPAGQTYKPNFGFGDLGSQGIAYDQASQRTVVFSDGMVIAYDASLHEWEVVYRVGPEAYEPSNRMDFSMAYDPVTGRIVIAGGRVRTPETWVEQRDVIAFDLATRQWSELLAPIGQ